MKRERSDSWYMKSWRPAAAYVYLFICLSDFVLMPVYYEYAKRIHSSEFVQLALKFPEGITQIEALRVIRQNESWEPLTLQATGLFHIAFGAILGVSAWTRSRDKREEIQEDRYDDRSRDPGERQ